jgi:hypothetical protein
MTKAEYVRKLAELERLLNDPEVAMEPSKVWLLAAEIAPHHEDMSASTGEDAADGSRA